MAAKHKIVWTHRAIKDLDNIYNFLVIAWSLKEAEKLLDLTLEFERLVSRYPQAFPPSKKYRGCYLGLIHRNLTAVYTVSGKSVIIITLFDNRSKSRYR